MCPIMKKTKNPLHCERNMHWQSRLVISWVTLANYLFMGLNTKSREYREESFKPGTGLSPGLSLTRCAILCFIIICLELLRLLKRLF